MPIKGLEKIEFRFYYTIRTIPLNQKFYLHPLRINFFSEYIVIGLDDYVYTEPLDDFPVVEIIKTDDELVSTSFIVIFEEVMPGFNYFIQNDEAIKKLAAFEEDYLWFPIVLTAEKLEIEELADAIEPPLVEAVADTIARKEIELQELVDDQNYEAAAKLREEIKILKTELQNKSS